MNSPLELWERIKALKNHDAIFILYVGGCIAEGILAIWIFNPVLLATAGVSKLLVLSFSFTIPLIGINSGFFSLLTVQKRANDETRWRMDTLPIGLLSSFILFGTPLLVSNLFKIEFRSFLISVVVLEFLFCVSCVCLAVTRKKDSKSSPITALESPATAPSDSTNK